MRLEEWRIAQKLSYEDLGRRLDMTTNKVYRICKNNNCIRLKDANVIVKETKNEVDFCDLLLEGDC